MSVPLTGERLILRRPDDWHVHLRDGALLRATIAATADRFGRAIVMPNLSPPVTTTAAARAYRHRILAAAPPNANFTPLMTAYLTDDSDPEDLARGFSAGVLTAVKLYPAHATTNAAKGVTDVRRVRPVLEALQRIGMPLLIHGEVTDPDIDVYDREAVFVERVLAPMLADFPDMRVVLEHISTEQAAAFVAAAGPNLAATITPHHLILNRNALFEGGLQPHHYCLPLAKRERHRLALRRAATSGDPKFFLGTDSAPHRITDKQSACGCAGIFNAPVALETCAEAFEQDGALDRLEAFVSEHGARFYRLPLNDSAVILERVAWRPPGRVGAPRARVVPFRAGEMLTWRFAGVASLPPRAPTADTISEGIGCDRSP